jgi:hypothetical protein
MAAKQLPMFQLPTETDSNQELEKRVVPNWLLYGEIQELKRSVRALEARVNYLFGGVGLILIALEVYRNLVR